MPVAVRVIPCLDVDDGRVVKGINFEDLRDAGDPVEMAAVYDAEGADELTFLDVTASSGERATMLDVVRRTAEQVFIPLTVGGGIRTPDDIDTLLRAGADKVGINTAAIYRPELLHEASRRFGAQCIVLSVDARTVPEGGRPTPSGWEVTTHGGRKGTGIDAVEWAARGQELGVGEILLNSMDADGTRAGFDLAMIEKVRAAVDVPVIAQRRRRQGRGLRARRPRRGRRGARSHRVPLRALPHRRRQAGHEGGRGGGQVNRVEVSQLDPAIAARLKRDADGLVCAIAQQRGTGEVLMVAWMDDEALHRTLTTGRATYWSRSREEYWVKGETSGHAQQVHEVRLDCDGDAVLLVVDQTGPACHTGTRTCFDADVLLEAR